MRMIRHSILTLVFLGACAPNPAQQPAPQPARQVERAETAPPAPRRVVLFIGDGVGVSYWTAARFASEQLNVEQFSVVGLVDTRSSSHRVTDSAAGATVYATGVRTFNGAIGVGPDSLPLQTVLELAEEKGMATGLVATSSITHATPASFAAHVPSRRMESEIARHIAEREVDVILGGGRRFFDGTAEGASNLLPELRERYTYVETAEELRALDIDTVTTLLGLFAEGHMDRASAGRTPPLPEMTRTALEILDRHPEGFFLMVEGSQPDWRGHANEPIEEVIAEMLDYDRAIGEALAYQARNPETLVVVVADHETGGLAIEEHDGELVAKYTTSGHTGQMIPLFAKGPGADAFAGLIANYRVGELLREAVLGTAAPVKAAASTDD